MAAKAEVVVPRFGTRGAVSDDVVTRFMAFFRQQLVSKTGLTVLDTELVSPGISGGLEAELGLIIAELGRGRYGLTGLIAESSDGSAAERRYNVSVRVVERSAEGELVRASDLVRASLQSDDYLTPAAELAAEVAGFIDPFVVLGEGSANLFITSDPVGAQIFINGIPIGQAPRELRQLASGRYHLELRKDGFLTESGVVVLDPDQTEFVRFELTSRQGGTVQVNSTPAAKVILNSQAMGTSPLALSAPQGEHEIRLERAGFVPATIPVEVQDFRVSRVTHRLEPRFSSMLFWSEQRDVLVFVDGVLQRGGYFVPARAALYRVELRRGAEYRRFSVFLPRERLFELDLDTWELVEFNP